MGRRYVRDKAGRFAPKGGGSKGKGGKMGKSAKNLKARASYKKASGKLREMKKFDNQMKAGSKSSQKYWKKQLGGAKSGMTRVSNRLAGKGKGAAATKAVGTGPKQARGVKKRRGAKVYDNSTNQMFKSRKLKRDLKRKYPESKAAKRVAAKAKKTTAAKKATAAKKKTYKGLTPKQQYKAARSKARAAKSGYAQDRGQGYDRAGKASGKGKVKRSMKLPGSDSARGVGSAKAQVTKLQKKFGKGATKGKGYGVSKKGQAAKSKFKDLKRQRGGVTKGRGTVEQRKKSLNVRTTQQAFGMKVKKPVSKAAQKYIGKQNVEASRVAASRGKGSKAKRRAAELAKKVPRTQKGAMAYDGPNKARSRAADRVKAKTKALRDARNLRNAAKASNTPKGAKKNYIKRANEIAKATRTPKATVGRKEKTAYKKQRSKNQPTYRVLAQSKGDKSPSAFIYKDAKAARKFAGSFKKAGKATFKALGGGNKQTRGQKKRKGAKTYDNTMSQFDTIKSTKLRLKRKYKYGL